jgi:hypothetical protein
MNSDAQNQSAGLDQKTIDSIAHSIWVAFNHVGLYSMKHPSTEQAFNECHEILTNCLQSVKSIVFHIQKEVLFCEDFKIENRNFGKRLLKRIINAEIESFSFSPGVEKKELVEFIGILCNPRDFRSVDDMSKGLEEKGVKRVRLNVIRYQKVMEGQVVVDEEEQKRSQAVLDDAEGLIDKSALNKVAGQASDADGAFATSVASRVAELRNMVNQKVTSAPASSDEIIAALSSLNKDISRDLKAEKAAGTIGQAQEDVLDEAEKLTFDTIVRIVREEYKAGKITVQRLANIVRRLVPDVADLKRLLPRLKETLLGAGMSQEDYLLLMDKLAGELENEGLGEILEEASKKAGLTVKEVLGDLKKSPEAAVQLILLSAEMQNMIGLDSQQLQSVVGEYIERITNELLLKSNQASSGESLTAMQQALSQVQQTLMNQIAEGGASADSIVSIGKQISSQIEEGKIKLQGTAQSPQPEPPKKESTLPKGVMGPKGIRVFLDLEIKRNRRYKSPLTCMCMSALVPDASGAYTDPSTEQLSDIMQKICDIMARAIRDLDLIGFLGSIESNRLIVILSMTPAQGAEVVKKRLEGLFQDIRTTANGVEIPSYILITLSPFILKSTPDLNTYVKHTLRQHKQQRGQLFGPRTD